MKMYAYAALVAAAVLMGIDALAKGEYEATAGKNTLIVAKVDSEHVAATLNGQRIVLTKNQAREFANAFRVGAAMVKKENSAAMQAEIKAVKEKYENKD
jgi:hypothetical protein